MSGDRLPSEPCSCQAGEPCSIHDEMEQGELEMRLKMCNEAIKFVNSNGDPFKVIPNYKIQRANIRAAMRKLGFIGEKPPTTTIGLKPGQMGAKILPGGK